MKLTRMAWRNLWRSKRRTLITAFSVGFGFALAVTFTGMAEYSYTNIINTGATMGFGHVTVEPAGYNDRPSLDKRIGETDSIRRTVSRLPGVSDAIVRIIGQAMFATATKSVGGMLIGMDPVHETPARNIFLRSMVEGSAFESSGGRGAVIGSEMARKLNLNIGKKLVYTATDIHGEIVSEIARVSGIYRTGDDDVDGSIVLLPIDSVRRALGYGRDEATVVSIFITDQRRAARMRDVIRTAVGRPDREVLDWKETQPDLAAVILLDRSGNYLFQILVGLLIAAGILNTMLMSVLERVREFGVMMALGLSPLRLVGMVIIESVWIGFIGIALGVVVFLPWYAYLMQSGIDLSGMVGEGYSAGGVIVDPVMKLKLYRETAAIILGGSMFLTLTAGLYPAFRAGRVLPVESLKTL
jgi:ABC-type lipoprotein release transport system permease subunit